MAKMFLIGNVKGAEELELMRFLVAFLLKLNMHLLYNPALSFLGFFQEKWNICPHKDLCANVSSFIHNCQKLETTQMSVAGEWVNKYISVQWNAHQQQKGTNDFILATTWMNLKYVILSERSQTHREKYCMIPLIWPSGRGKTIGTKN